MNAANSVETIASQPRISQLLNQQPGYNVQGADPHLPADASRGPGFGKHQCLGLP